MIVIDQDQAGGGVAYSFYQTRQSSLSCSQYGGETRRKLQARVGWARKDEFGRSLFVE
jgi:hypothetical protein